MRLLDSLRKLRYMQIFTIYVRYLIGGAFVISAFTLNKLGIYDAPAPYAGQTPVEQLDPIGRFFRVMFDSGLYWNFIGWCQVLTGLLLMTQKLARLGALGARGKTPGLRRRDTGVDRDLNGSPMASQCGALKTSARVGASRTLSNH